MALNAEQLGEAIMRRVEDARKEIAKLFEKGDTEGGMKKVWTEVAIALIDHFKANAEITPDGSPPFEADSSPVIGKGKIT